MYVDDVGLRVEMVVPHIFQQHRPGYDMTGVAHQVFQELKLPRQEFDDLVAALHRAGQQIELEIGDAKPGLGRTLGATAEQRLDARQQFAERKGLDEIIVAAGAQRSEEHTSELQSPCNLVCRLLLEKKKHIRETVSH